MFIDKLYLLTYLLFPLRNLLLLGRIDREWEVYLLFFSLNSCQQFAITTRLGVIIFRWVTRRYGFIEVVI